MEKVELQSPFWVVEITNKKGETGFAVKGVDDVKISMGGFSTLVTLFKTKSDANSFINRSKLHKLGKVRIVSGNEIAEKYGSVADDKRDLWIIKNEEGLYLKYSEGKNTGYYFEEEKVGACMFDDIIHMGEFIKAWQPQFNVSKLTPVLLRNDKKL